MPPADIPRWDHEIAYLKANGGPTGMTEQLDEMGRQGWELVSVAYQPSEITDEVLVAFFKRPVLTEAGTEKPWAGFPPPGLSGP
jgi:hypothetical protein